ncbi:MAG: glycosyltransferase family 39 protein [Planctomycetes bacterium]|nr:glycosyltransferase family 39 protein [Planctomycetota bacterium]
MAATAEVLGPEPAVLVRARRARTEPLLLAATLGVSLLLAVVMPVFAQESYYWCYSEHPALSYYDHPPMVAWLIRLGTWVFGDGALGIRLFSWLCGSAGTLAGLLLLRAFAAPRSSRVAWLVLTLIVPSLVSVRFLTNPDPALCGFWLLAMLALWRARDGATGWWLLAGLFTGGALLSKYTACFLLLGGGLVTLGDGRLRRQLTRPGPYLAVLVALLVFLPVILWNFGNDFESFRFQTTNRWAHARLGTHWFGQLLAGQAAVLNPVVIVALVIATAWLVGGARRRDMRAFWLLAFGLPMLVFLIGNALFVQVKINWLIPAMQPLLLGTALWWGSSGFRLDHPVATRRGLRAALAFGGLLALGPAIVLVPQDRGSTWSGWDEIASRAEQWEESIDTVDGTEGNVFFFAGDYRDAAQLSRSLELGLASAPPGEVREPTLAQNVVGRAALQFDHWEDPAGRIGQSAIFVLPRPRQRASLLDEVRQHFDSVERVDHVDVRRWGIEVLDADIFVCRGYKGPHV